MAVSTTLICKSMITEVKDDLVCPHLQKYKIIFPTVGYYDEYTTHDLNMY